MRIDDTNGVLARSADGVGVFSVNKMLGSLSNLGPRILRGWDSDFS